MRSYSESKVFSGAAMDLFARATALVDEIPIYDAYFLDVRCHELARAIGECLGLAVVDGHYGQVQHSWLIVPNATPIGDSILDVYAVGAVPMVRMIDQWPGLPHGPNEYRVGDDRDDVDYDMVGALLQIFNVVERPIGVDQEPKARRAG